MRNCALWNLEIPGSVLSHRPGRTGGAMVSFGSRKVGQRAVMSEEFERELMREVLRTELIRVRAVILTSAMLMLMFAVVYLVAPQVVERIWRGSGLFYPYVILMSLIAFEFWIHSAITRHL